MWNRRTVSQQCWPYVITITKNHWEFSNSMGQISSELTKPSRRKRAHVQH
uniref:Uncharacterized protein n=1 Tax=Anguilla anguilla TaxID=7936 RepID=A0A0E9R1Z1_ANGAN